MKKTISKNKGFTLVELLVVIAILAILGSVSIIGYMQFEAKAFESNFKTEVAQFKRYFYAELTSNPKIEYTYSLKFDDDGDDIAEQTGTLEYTVDGLYLTNYLYYVPEDGEEDIRLNLDDFDDPLFDFSEFGGSVSFWLTRTSDPIYIYNEEFKVNSDSEVCQYKVHLVQYTSSNDDYYSVFEFDSRSTVSEHGDVIN